MKRPYYYYLLVFILILGISGCVPLDALIETESESDKINIIQNGHMTDSYTDDNLNSPCCVMSSNIGIVCETQLVDTKSKNKNDILLLKIHLINAETYSRHISVDDVKVYCDEKELSLFKTDEVEIIETTLVQSSDYDGILLTYKLPKEASINDVQIEFKPVYLKESLQIKCSENGYFTDEDIEILSKEHGEIYNKKSNYEYQVPVLEATSNSFYHSNKSDIDYTADLIIDGDFSTCWQEGSVDWGIGETLTFSFQQCTINRIDIVNGNRRHDDSYDKNGRISEATLLFYLDNALIDTYNINIEDNAEQEVVSFSLESSIDCDSVVLQIDSVFEGTDYTDTGISEIMFYASDSNEIMDLLYDIVFAKREVVIKATSTPAPTYIKTTVPDDPNYIHTGSMDNPTVVGYDEIPYFRNGIYVKITGKARLYSTDEGKIYFADKPIYHPDCGYGIELEVYSDDGKYYRTVEALSVNPGDFDEYFRDINRSELSGKTVTIVGRIILCNADADGDIYQYYCFSSDSKIVAVK